jgi:hypothetical protein
LAYPNWRAEYENAYRAYSTIPLKQWPTAPVDMRDHCSLWCIRRHDFARWYRVSPLSAGASLESFCPDPRAHESLAGAALREPRGDQLPQTRKPGRPLEKRDSVEAEMKRDIDANRITRQTLAGMKQIALANQYGVSRETACAARNNVLSEIAGNQ